MKYMYQDKIFDTQQAANEYAAPLRAQYLEQESHRFSIVREVVNGSDAVWVAADLAVDPEDSVYFVFNTMTGSHEKTNSKTEAIDKLAQLKTEFLTFSGLDVKELTDLEALSYMNLLVEPAPSVL